MNSHVRHLAALVLFCLLGVGAALSQAPQFVPFSTAEPVLNTYLASLPDARALLNQLHAFFGVGALLGPVVASWIVGFASWTVVYLVLAVAYLPLVIGFLVSYPRQQTTGSLAPLPGPPPPLPADGGSTPCPVCRRPVMLAAMRRRRTHR